MGINSVAIGTYIEPELVDKIRLNFPKLIVIYEPDILPKPRYKCDHTGPARELSGVELAKWLQVTAGVDAYFDFDWYKPQEMIKRSPGLQWIQATSAGIGGFMKRTGLDLAPITVTTAGGIHAVPLSEFALTGALYFTKSLPQLNRWKGEKHWQRYTTSQLAGKRILIIGLGGIGRKASEIFSALGVDVIGLGRTKDRKKNANVRKVVSREEMKVELPGVDIILVCCPLTDETEGLIGVEEFSMMKTNTILINISRGQVVDQASMIESLKDGRLLGACLDVFDEEPLGKENPLWQMPNVLISPHSASTVDTENSDLVDLFCENLTLIESGREPRNLYLPVRGY